jgi:hypothetical protein
MALALDAVEVPLEFYRWEEVSDAIRGVDEVEVGPDPYQVSYETLEEERPDALGSIRWDPIPPLAPISPQGAARVKARV